MMVLETIVIGVIMWGGWAIVHHYTKEIDKLNKMIGRRNEEIFQLEQKLKERGE